MIINTDTPGYYYTLKSKARRACLGKGHKATAGQRLSKHTETHTKRETQHNNKHNNNIITTHNIIHTYTIVLPLSARWPLCHTTHTRYATQHERLTARTHIALTHNDSNNNNTIINNTITL